MSIRDQLVDYLKAELIGPDPGGQHQLPEDAELLRTNNEWVRDEILVSERPSDRYYAGVLFHSETDETQAAEQGAVDNDIEPIQDVDDDLPVDNGVQRQKDAIKSTQKLINRGTDLAADGRTYHETATQSLDDKGSDGNQYVERSTDQKPSSMGMTVFLEDGQAQSVLVIRPEISIYHKGQTGDYEYSFQKDGQEETRTPTQVYFRVPLACEEWALNQQDLPEPFQMETRDFSLNYEYQNGENTEVFSVSYQLVLVNRTTQDLQDHGTYLTVSLVNTDPHHRFYQTSFTLSSNLFGDIGSHQDNHFKHLHFDDQVNDLLYRKVNRLAIGHGCSPVWEETEQHTIIRAAAIPEFDLKSVIPTSFQDMGLEDEVTFKMDFLANVNQDPLNPLEIFANAYENWLKEKENEVDQLETHFTSVAEQNLQTCRECLGRIRQGIEALNDNEQALHAFRLMNQAMSEQQVRSKAKLRKWLAPENAIPGDQPILDLSFEQATMALGVQGKWRPFQLAFILINIKGMVESGSEDRQLVDIIWFPTGGGKTEAYLGLSAFNIFYQRLHSDLPSSGPCVLMRYTLRMLTAQQFERASSLICACEKIRRENQKGLGVYPIEIGIWIGSSSTENRRNRLPLADNAWNTLTEDNNKIGVLKCPWCAAQMGPIAVRIARQGISQNKGYHRTDAAGGAANDNRGRYISENLPDLNPPPTGYTDDSTIHLYCPDGNCFFNQIRLPIQFLDEDIYANPPALLIATIDKFAMLPMFPEAAGLLGRYRDGTTINGPQLIIQDELHLISGPLGSIAGQFEMIIDHLLRKDDFFPKIIASTATISRASEQAHALYNCTEENVRQFPPPVLDVGESFFARVDHDSPGRKYVGVQTPILSGMFLTRLVIASLLQGASEAEPDANENRDNYYTLLHYFNSLFELGRASTLIQSDIIEHLRVIWRRRHPQLHRTMFLKAIELTSRISGTELKKSMEILEEGGQYPPDICLATNMISVGVDIDRLGLMVMAGQPKTTTEYIQASSRVGRSSNAPGLVVVLYNPMRPRDRSVYEHFQSFHARIYSRVEASGVTPFTVQVRKRVLKSLLVAFMRIFEETGFLKDTPGFDHDNIQTFQEAAQEFSELYLERVGAVDPQEENEAESDLKHYINEWLQYRQTVQNYMHWSIKGAPQFSYLLYEYGRVHRDTRLKWPVLTSMRNVDATCEVGVS